MDSFRQALSQDSRLQQTLQVLRDMPGLRENLEDQTFLEDLATGLRAFETRQFEYENLQELGLPVPLRESLMLLLRPAWMSQWRYYLRLSDGFEQPRIVVVADMIARVRSATMTEKTHLQDEARECVFPLTGDMPPPWGDYLRFELIKALG